jgi:hypothetical protein
MGAAGRRRCVGGAISFRRVRSCAGPKPEYGTRPTHLFYGQNHERVRQLDARPLQPPVPNASVALRSPGAGGAGKEAPAALVKQLGRQKINNIFTHLRKIAQHPLLVRALYSDQRVRSIAKVAKARCAASVPASRARGPGAMQLRVWCRHAESEVQLEVDGWKGGRVRQARALRGACVRHGALLGWLWQRTEGGAKALDWVIEPEGARVLVAARGAFGAECSEARVYEELSGYSDRALHDFCLRSGIAKLRSFLLDESEVRRGACWGLGFRV